LSKGLVFSLLVLTGCATDTGNVGNVQSYAFPAMETGWIRDGEPIEFEGESWYPADGTEALLDSEVYYLGEYQGVKFFVDKLDVRPYERLYTKFGKNEFRYFKRRKSP
jgi:hypothetical protein